MNKLLLLLAVCLTGSLGLTAQETAPSPREIGDAYIENTGGEEAYRNVQSMKMEGKSMMQGMEFPMTVVTSDPNKLRIDVDIQGSPMTQAFDGETAWMLFPMQGITEPKEMSEEEAQGFRETPFLSEFIDTEERGYMLEAVEGKEIEGTPTYGVRVTNDEDYDRTYYFDTENMVPIMMVSTMKGGQMTGMEMESYLSDYQEVEGGYIMPMYTEQKVNGQTFMQMTYDEVEINPEVEEGYFSVPE